jgi:hypothetical protein
MITRGNWLMIQQGIREGKHLKDIAGEPAIRKTPTGPSGGKHLGEGDRQAGEKPVRKGGVRASALRNFSGVA